MALLLWHIMKCMISIVLTSALPEALSLIPPWMLARDLFA
jgi:hypothetical protein